MTIRRPNTPCDLQDIKDVMDAASNLIVSAEAQLDANSSAVDWVCSIFRAALVDQNLSETERDRHAPSSLRDLEAVGR